MQRVPLAFAMELRDLLLGQALCCHLLCTVYEYESREIPAGMQSPKLAQICRAFQAGMVAGVLSTGQEMWLELRQGMTRILNLIGRLRVFRLSSVTRLPFSPLLYFGGCACTACLPPASFE